MKGKEKIVEEIFRKSKKTIRSPVKMRQEGRMRDMFKEMRKKIRKELTAIKKEIREIAEGQRR